MKKIRQNQLSDKELAALLLKGVEDLDWLLPETVEAVARAEKAAPETNLPAALQDPFAALNKASKARRFGKIQPAEFDTSVLADLARAARKGGDSLTPEVEQRMHQDRKRAERERDQE